jgi:hypothetical protein
MSKFVIVDGKQITFLKEYFEPEILKQKIKINSFHFYAFVEIPLCDFKEITEYINSTHIDIKNGDVIVFCDPDILYRNAGKCIWYNGNAIPLSHNCDEYGEVPECFEITPTQYHPRYWKNTIAHNRNYWPCQEYRAQCCHNMTIHNVSNTKEQIRYTWFVHNDIKEYVVLEPEYNISDEEFKELLNDVRNPFGEYYYDYYVKDMNQTNTSMVHKYSYYL